MKLLKAEDCWNLDRVTNEKITGECYQMNAVTNAKEDQKILLSELSHKCEHRRILSLV
jgi:hypothetical protein